MKHTESAQSAVVSLTGHRPRTHSQGQQQSLAFLVRLGDTVRALRKSRKLSRRVLSEISGVSERYLAQLESGSGNVSIVLLRDISLSLGVPLDELIRTADAAENAARGRASRVALVGLRGAGKSTLGRALARRLGCKFIELNDVIRELSGLPISELINLYGQDGYRRFENEALNMVAQQRSEVVLEVAGGIVSELETYDALLSNFHTIWLKATPEEHMARVRAQGDLRPMENHPGSEAQVRLRQILDERMKEYARAGHTYDTSGLEPEVALEGLQQLVGEQVLAKSPAMAG